MDDEELSDLLLLIENAILHVKVCVESEDMDLESLKSQSELLVRNVVLLEAIVPAVDEALVSTVMELAKTVQMLTDEHHRQKVKGRREIRISEDHLAVLLEQHFAVSTIANMFRVSPRTIRRRILEYGLDEAQSFSNISDDQLDTIVHHFVGTHPNSGQRSLEGFLRSFGLRIQRQRIRDTMQRVDPSGVENRLRQALHRRRYNVCMPNSLWHIDGYHKLIRWRIVIHGGIDGYSRLPVFLQASTNNRSDTVLQCFLEGVRYYGLPSRVRCDRGRENVLVSQFMLTHPQRGPGRNSCITGRSVHNQRIERFWRDLFTGCVSLFYGLFYMLEDMQILDPTNTADLFALQYIFLPRINLALNVFKESYAHHRLRTAGNCSPYQLWMRGIVEGNGDANAVQGILDESLVCS